MAIRMLNRFDFVDLSRYLKSEPVSVLLFRADWGHCDSLMLRRFRRVSSYYEREVNFGVIDMEEIDLDTWSTLFAISEVPTLVYCVRDDKLFTEAGVRGLYSIRKTIGECFRTRTLGV